MPYDITLCPGRDCPVRARCYRFRAVPAGRQAWFGTTPYDHARGTCDSFWDIDRLKPTEADIRTRAYYIWQAGGGRDDSAAADWDAAQSEFGHRFTELLRPGESG